MIHKLKILPEFFPLVEKGKKRFELRKNDRNYQEDDILLLQEYFDGEYTGRQCVVKITNVFGSNNEESLWPELKKLLSQTSTSFYQSRKSMYLLRY